MTKHNWVRNCLKMSFRIKINVKHVAREKDFSTTEKKTQLVTTTGTAAVVGHWAGQNTWIYSRLGYFCRGYSAATEVINSTSGEHE